MTKKLELLKHVTSMTAGVVLGALLLSALPTSKPQTAPGPATPQNPPLQPMIPAFGTADSNRTMIAVTGIDLTGSSILYLVDTEGRHMAVYQANGGADSTQGIKLVGARRIDLDLQLEGYNDKSEYTVRELEKKFAEIGRGSTESK